MTAFPTDDSLLEFAIVSRARAGLPAAAIARIGREAQVVNVAHGLCGHLTYRDGRFHQMIEGPLWEIVPLAARILADPRHCEICIQAFGPLRHRRFAQWQSCGFETFGAAADAVDAMAENVRPLDPGAAPPRRYQPNLGGKATLYRL